MDWGTQLETGPAIITTCNVRFFDRIAPIQGVFHPARVFTSSIEAGVPLCSLLKQSASIKARISRVSRAVTGRDSDQ